MFQAHAETGWSFYCYYDYFIVRVAVAIDVGIEWLHGVMCVWFRDSNGVLLAGKCWNSGDELRVNVRDKITEGFLFLSFKICNKCPLF